MKTPYTFVTLRYVHDVMTGEFANVGVVLYAPSERYLQARFTASCERLNALFLRIDHAHFRNVMRYMTNRFEELQAEIGEGLELTPVQVIGELVRQVLPPDDSSLQWSPMGGGFSEDLNATVQEVFARFVERYTRQPRMDAKRRESAEEASCGGAPVSKA